MKDFLETCIKRGIYITLKDDNNLSYKTTKGPIDKETIAYLREHKMDIINYLKFPLTDIQSAYLSGRSLNYELGGSGCYTYLILKCKKLDASRFEKAWHKTIENHEMLRAVITKEGQQYIKNDIDLPMLQVYVSDTEDILQSDTEKKIREELYSYDFSIDSWPMHKIILHQGKEESIVHFCVDMLIADYISINVILEDIFSWYETGEFVHALKGQSFRETVINKKLKGYKKESEEYWKNKILTHEFRKPLLPVKNNISNENVRFKRLDMILKREEVQALRQAAKDNNVTVSNAVLAAYAAVLARWSENKKFCINVTLMDRKMSEMDTVGDYTSVDILAVNTEGKSFADLARNIGIDLLTDMAYMDYTGVDVLRQVRRAKSKENIFPVVFTSTVGEKESGIESPYIVIGGISRTPQVWIDCQMLTIGEEMDIHWDVREGVFEEKILVDLFSTFKDTIKALTKEKDWNKEDILTIKEDYLRKRVKYLSVDESLKGKPLYKGFIDSLKAHPDKTAIIYDDKSYTYKNLGEYTAAIQRKLRDAGIKKGDRVAIIQERSLKQTASALAVLLLGAAFVPVDINQPFERKKTIIQQSESSLLIVSGESYMLQDEYKDKICDVEDIEPIEADSLLVEEIKTTSTAYIIFTSGTTGVPKGVMISHQSAQNTLYDVNKRFGVTDKDVFLALTKFSFDLSIYDMFGSMDAAATTVIPKESNALNPSDWARLIRTYKVTIWNSVPALLKMLFAEVNIQDKQMLESLRLILLSGDVISPDLPKTTAKYLEDYKLISLGGATEGSVWSLFWDVTKWQDEGMLPYGVPLTNQAMYVLDEDNKDCPDIVKGEICIGGYGVATGYYGDKDLTASKFINIDEKKDRLFKTGDIGFYTTDGILMINGRKDDQIKINGNRVETGEIESVIRSTSEVLNAVVHYHKNEKSSKLFAFLEAGYEDKAESEINYDDFMKAGMKELDKIDREGFTRWRKQSDIAALSDMLALFSEFGIFTDKEKIYKKSDIHEAIKETSEFHSIIDRFLRAMEQAGIIIPIEEGYKVTEAAKLYYDRDKNWDDFMRIGDEIGYGHVLMEYQRESGRRIKEQVRGEIAGISLFFPQGETEVAEAAYRNNIINLRLNYIVSDIINRLGRDDITILEVGAGVGGTTTTVLERLENKNIRYCFTDVSQFFLNKAKDRYKDYKNISYKLMDINRDYKEQGFGNGEYDIILCANVLHNSSNIGTNLSKLKKLLKDDGHIIIIEATRESCLLTTSLELKGGLDGFTDHRRGGIDVFTSEDKWIELIKEAGYRYIYTLPEKSDALAECGQSVFLCKNETIKKRSRRRINVEYIEKTMAEKLPKYMIPEQIEILESLPLTVNGKIDRKALDQICAERLKTATGKRLSTDNKLSGNEKAVADIWGEILGIRNIDAKDNFYYLGGDSLLITQVVSKLKDSYDELKNMQWDELMQLVLNNPTVEGMAEALGKYILIDDTESDKEAGKNTESDVRLETEQKEYNSHTVKGTDSCLRIYRDNPTKRRYVQAYMHAGTGRLVDYDLLIPQVLKASDECVSVVGFMYGNSEEYLSIPADKLLKYRAAKYAELLIDMDAEAYEIIGYCVGGFLAIETARILLERGKKVSNVFMIASEQATHKICNRLITEMAYGVAVGLDVSLAGYSFDISNMKEALTYILSGENRDIKNSELITLSGKYRGLGNMFLRLIDSDHEERLREIFNKAGGSRFNGDDSTYAMFNILYKIFEHTFKGMSEYMLDEYYLGSVVYMEAPTDYSFYPVTRKLNEIEDMCAGDFVKIRIPGNHATCIDNNNYMNIFNEMKNRSICFK